ncbi:radical SAM/SPASM domain-containing protein [Streptosporangium subroseum]|uniref:radical SAM/SPASM domain-containing protein n=1 Tax=Streptosporangium subroseum TaxID=106412 RepID=UPI00308D68E3|nr:radical SAM protein [Streptosporangium subroseum]
MSTGTTTWLEEYMRTAKAGELAAPPSAWWIVTRACNLKCYYCFADARKRDPDELNTAEAKAVLDDFAASGVMFTTFLGGEPLTRKDIYELVDYSTDLGIYTALLTNGLNVRNEKIDRLVDGGLEMIGVSIDSKDDAIHDAVRGVKGSLAGAKGTIRHAISRGLRTSVRIVVTEDSYPAIPDLFRWAIDEGVEELILLPIFMVGRAAGGTEDRRADVIGKQLFLKTLERLKAVGEPLGITVPTQERLACPQGIELRAPDHELHHAGHAVGFEQSSGCKVGRFMVSVQPNGEVFPCPFVHAKVGSLREQSIVDIWQAPLMKRARSEDLGCLSRSIIHTGRPDVVDPTYVRSAEEILAELPPAPVAGQEAVPGETAQPADRPFFPVDGLSIASYSARTTPAPVRSTP